ncbi:MAG: hypothetical protein N3E48_02460, partial [Candidatus Bathyarchaeota archaeon]|nr:hypothetical protein [Candidatus Bathyarchaeota archaeon]
VKKSVKGVVITSSGFKETGFEGKKLEDEIIKIAREAGIRVVGPNTTGTLNMSNGFTTTFTVVPERKIGPLSFIAQTGLFAGVTLNWFLTSQKYGLAKVFGLGNMCDVNETEALEYLAQDPETKIIALYLEGLGGGGKFFDVAKKVSRKKFIIVLKSGRTQIGAEAAKSHTGSLAVRDDIFDSACRQTGIIRVDDFEEMFDVIKMLVFQPLPKRLNVGVVSMTGAGGVLAVDSCTRYGVNISKFSQKTVEYLQSLMPEWGRIGVFIDVEPLVEKFLDKGYKVAFESAIDDQNITCVLLILLILPNIMITEDFVKQTVENIFVEGLRRNPGKAVILHTLGEKKVLEFINEFLEEKLRLPTYPGIERCVKVLAKLNSYIRYLKTC